MNFVFTSIFRTGYSSTVAHQSTEDFWPERATWYICGSRFWWAVDYPQCPSAIQVTLDPFCWNGSDRSSPTSRSERSSCLHRWKGIIIDYVNTLQLLYVALYILHTLTLFPSGATIVAHYSSLFQNFILKSYLGGGESRVTSFSS